MLRSKVIQYLFGKTVIQWTLKFLPMNINFNRRKVETTCIFISFLLVVLLTIFGILAIADSILSWDIFSEKVEKIAGLLMSATGIVIGATFFISLMVNFSLISSSMEKIADNLTKDKKSDE